MSLFALALAASVLSPAADGWIGAGGGAKEARPVVLHFRREFTLRSAPKRFPVRVTADNRYVLYVNGTRVIAGPSTGDVGRWRYEAVDLAPWLKSGNNVIAAVVWNGVQPLVLPAGATPAQISAAKGAQLFSGTAPMFQTSVATGFRLMGDGAASSISSDRGGWRVERDGGHGFGNGFRQVRYWYYVAGNPETIDAGKASFGWTGPRETGQGWADAVPVPAAAARTLVLDRLPPQSYAPVAVGRVVRSDRPDLQAFPDRPVTVPANAKVTFLLRRDAMVSAYPELDVAGGRGAEIRVTWAEALYDQDRLKGDRNLIGDRKPIGIWDTFIADGGSRTFATLWWRTWRYAEVTVTTKDEPLTLKGFRAFETGYPFRKVGGFASDDGELGRIFDIGWRTARIDAHETYMDTGYWEQLQYAGDARLQMLISYAVSGDPRLAEQAIDAFAASVEDGGLMRGAAPSRDSDVIATFALVWVGMLDDWRMQQPDPAPIRRNLERMRRVLGWFDKWQQPSGLLGRNPQWNFIDWAGQLSTDRDTFPSYGKSNESCLTSVSWLGALEQGARIEVQLGDPAKGVEDRSKAETLKRAIRNRCWVASRGIFADNPDGDRFSQHMNALAILYDVVPAGEAQAILDRISVSGRGIAAPEGIAPVSYYFAWYLAQAYTHVGRADRYVGLLQTWRDLLKLNYTTWPEERDGAGQLGKGKSTRSDSHAWSAHPTADLLGIVAGIGPGAPGYKRVRVAPALGGLRRVEATAATPSGAVSVRYLVKGDVLAATITRPAALPGEFVWRGRSYPLARATTVLKLPVGPPSVE